jgi:hypothetical protein
MRVSDKALEMLFKDVQSIKKDQEETKRLLNHIAKMQADNMEISRMQTQNQALHVIQHNVKEGVPSPPDLVKIAAPSFKKWGPEIVRRTKP